MTARQAGFVRALDDLRARIYPLARFVHKFAGTLDPPSKDRAEAGYRFAIPGVEHFGSFDE
jgi:hypothetical protein